MRCAIQQLEERAGRSESWDKMLREVQHCYVGLRESLVHLTAKQHVGAVCSTKSLPEALRECCVYLARLSADEFELVGCLFQTQGAASILSVFLHLLETIWSLLHDAVRPIIITQVDLDQLCLVLEVLTLEVPELVEQMHPTVCTLLTPVIGRLAQDAQERLIYRAQAFMTAKIASFYPTPAQLQYPALIEGNKDDPKQCWYPTLVCTLDLLSKVRCMISIVLFNL